MAHVEPMDIDNVGSDFDDKENSLQNNNFLPRTPCTEKGYEELDVSELNMKLRYSTTPASSPMSKSYTAMSKENKSYHVTEDSFNNAIVNNNGNLTRSLNSSITKCDIVSKSPKLPLQALPTDQYLDINSSVRRSFDNDSNNIIINVNEIDNIQENLSLPSTSSSSIQTPEATTPTKDIPKGDGGSPIMRGLKSVLNMFRSSQSPIPPEDNIDNKVGAESPLEEEEQIKSQMVLASTPKAVDKNKDNNSSKRSSPLKDSVIFNDDLERELQWKDETTIIFKQEKIPIHKLFLNQSTSLLLEKKLPTKINDTQNFNSTAECMDISDNECGIGDKTVTDIESKVSSNIELTSGVESDGEFLDCETTYTKNDQNDTEQKNNSTITVERNYSTQEQELVDECCIIKDTETIYTKELSLDAKEVQTDTGLFRDINEQGTDGYTISQKELDSSLKDVIHLNKDINLTTELNISANTKTEPNDCKNQSNIIMLQSFKHNDENKGSESEKENKGTEFENDNKETEVINETNLSNAFDCSVNEEIILSNDDKQLIFDATRPLNIVTDYQDNMLINKNNDSSNFVLIEKDNIDIYEDNVQPLNSGILQICDNVSENNGHKLANNTLKNISTTFDSEQNINENEIKIDQIMLSFNEKPQATLTFPIPDNSETNSSIDQDTKKNNSVNVEYSLDHNNDVPYLANQLNTEKDENISISLNENEIQNNKEITINTLSTNNDLENNNLQNIENIIELHDLPYSDLPTDIPLPSDDDIEKDSLIDHFAIKNNVEDEDVETLACIIEDKTTDVIETMDVCSEDAVGLNSEHSKDFDSISPAPNVPLPNQDQIQENVITVTENISSLLMSSCYLLNDKIEIVQESAPGAIPDQKLNLPHTVSEVNPQNQYKNSAENLNQEMIEGSASDVGFKDYQCISNANQTMEVNNLDNNNYNTILEEHNSEVSNSVVQLKEIKTSDDDEIVTSENNSPFVSVNNIDVEIPKNDMKLDEIDRPFETKSKIATSPPISPKLTRKGYNINFDEIDDPFATKSNIRISPTPDISPKNCSISVNESPKKTNNQKRVQQQNRRRSQPERQKRDATKRRFNSTHSNDASNRKEQIDIPLNQNINDKNTIRDVNNTIDSNGTATTASFYTDNVIPSVLKTREEDNSDIANKTPLNSEEAVMIEESTENSISEQKSVSENILAGISAPRNVFNLPEIDDMNFNPFASKSKIRKSPSPEKEKENTLIMKSNITSDPSIEITERQEIEKLISNFEKNTQEDKVVSSDDISSETCSSKNTDRDFTVREIHTEDEDTVEGPFLEAEEFADVVKVTDFGTEADMMQFEDLQDINNENKEDGELFIDAEAFQFLLNQNKTNVVADSGKESLFLKFDPLFAKRVSSDGVLAALNRIQKRQSTPKKPPQINQKNAIDEEKPSISSSNEGAGSEENIDETNIMVTKPMMVVNPAINSLVSPRKSVTPPRINRRSLTLTSPAMAVIDRLLSLSGNTSTLDHDTSMPRMNREYHETDVALTQLRELLAEKEIHVHNLRSESKELKERLSTMESQVKTLEKESEERLKKVNDLNGRLTEKMRINKSMAVVVEEYERTIASLIAEMEHEKRRNAEERTKLINERDEQTAHLASMEVSFNDLHSKYEKSKQIILSMKANEDTYRKSIKEFEDSLLKMQNNYELLKQHATSKLNHANQELEKYNRTHESEVLKLNAMIKRKELHITSLEESLIQKTKANEELTAICDELINKVG